MFFTQTIINLNVDVTQKEYLAPYTQQCLPILNSDPRRDFLIVVVVIRVVIMINITIFEDSTVLDIVRDIGTNTTRPRCRNKACNLFGQRLVHNYNR